MNPLLFVTAVALSAEIVPREPGQPSSHCCRSIAGYSVVLLVPVDRITVRVNEIQHRDERLEDRSQTPHSGSAAAHFEVCEQVRKIVDGLGYQDADTRPSRRG